MAAATLVDPAAEPPTEDVPSTKETVELSAKEPVNESLKEQTTTESPVPKKAITTPAPKADIPAGVPSGLPSLDPAVQPTVTNPEAMVEERGNVSSLYVGRVIGKGGEMIRDLQARSGCRIDVDQNVPQGQPRIITYRGTRRTVEDAKKMVSLLCQEDGNETLLPIGEAKRKQMSVPSSSIGKIIGRGGEMIRELQNKSQAKIQVDHSGNSQQGNMRSMTITGTSQAVLKAEEMVLFLVANPLMDATVSINMLIDDKAKNGGRWGSGPPYLNMPNHGQNMMPQGQQPPQQQQQHQPNPYGGGGYGHGGPPAGGGGYSGYQQQQPPPHQGGGSGHYGMPPPQQSYFGMPGASEVEVFFAAKMYMGRIIGQRGVTINDVQKRSGCDIQVNQNVSPGQDCEITIKGSRQGIESVKQMIREIIEMGPNHPYAGGQGRKLRYMFQKITFSMVILMCSFFLFFFV
jgi:rRNA processing protein Krr1/Pno1